jgi:hypothetical protein
MLGLAKSDRLRELDWSWLELPFGGQPKTLNFGGSKWLNLGMNSDESPWKQSFSIEYFAVKKFLF